MGKKTEKIVAALPSEVSVESIKIMKNFNSRTVIGDIEDLSSSIKATGILCPLLVRPGKKEGEYELISGERRLTVAKALKLKTVPVLVRTDLNEDVDAKAANAAENIARNSLDAIDEASALKGLIDSGMTPNKAGSVTGCSGQKVRQCLKLLEAPKKVLDAVRNGELSKSAAITVASLDADIQKKVLPTLTVDSTERQVKELANQIAREEAAEAGDEGAKKTSKSGGKKNLPSSQEEGTLAAWHTKGEARNEMENLVEQIEQAKAQEEPHDFLLGALAGLLWFAGELEEIKSEGKAFTKAYKRVYDSMEWESEEADEAEEPAAEDKPAKKSKAKAAAAETAEADDEADAE
jgi:ParB/RepB/Spo0J family partition protein